MNEWDRAEIEADTKQWPVGWLRETLEAAKRDAERLRRLGLLPSEVRR